MIVSSTGDYKSSVTCRCKWRVVHHFRTERKRVRAIFFFKQKIRRKKKRIQCAFVCFEFSSSSYSYICYSVVFPCYILCTVGESLTVYVVDTGPSHTHKDEYRIDLPLSFHLYSEFLFRLEGGGCGEINTRRRF